MTLTRPACMQCILCNAPLYARAYTVLQLLQLREPMKPSLHTWMTMMICKASGAVTSWSAVCTSLCTTTTVTQSALILISAIYSTLQRLHHI